MPAPVLTCIDRWTAIEFRSTSGRLGIGRSASVPAANADRFSILALMAVRSTTFGRIVTKRRTSAPNAGWEFLSNGTTGNLELLRVAATTNLSYVTNNTPLAAFLSRVRWAWILCEYNEDYSAGSRVRMAVRDYFGGRWIDATFGTTTDGVGGYSDDSAQGIRIGNNQGGGSGSSGRLLALCSVLNPLTIGAMKRAIDTGRVLELRKQAFSFVRPGTRLIKALEESRFMQGLNSGEQWRLANTYNSDFRVVSGPPILLDQVDYDLLEQDEEPSPAGGAQTLAPAAAVVTVTVPSASLVGSGSASWAPSPASVSVTVPAATLAGTGSAPFAPAAAVVTVTSPAATLSGSGSVALSPAAAAVSVTVPAATISVGAAAQTLTPAAAIVTVTSPTPAFLPGPVALAVAAAVVTVTAPSATFASSGAALFSPAAAVVTVTAPAAILVGGLTLVGVQLTAIAVTAPTLSAIALGVPVLASPAVTPPTLSSPSLT